MKTPMSYGWTFQSGSTEFKDFTLYYGDKKEFYLFTLSTFSANCATFSNYETRKAVTEKIKEHCVFDEDTLVSQSSSGGAYYGAIPHHYESGHSGGKSGVIDEVGVRMLHLSHALLFAIENRDRDLSAKIIDELFSYTFPGVDRTWEKGYELDEMIKEFAPRPYVICTSSNKEVAKFPISQEEAARLRRANLASIHYVMCFWLDVYNKPIPQSSEEAVKMVWKKDPYNPSGTERYPQYYEQIKHEFD